MTGDELKAAREKIGESQQALAKRLGISQASIARWEQEGLPRRGTAKLAVEKLLAEFEERQ